MNWTDYHTHTPLCHHAEGNVEDYVAAAVKAGLVEYGISDHAPMPHEPFDDWRMSQADLPAYFDWIDQARSLGAEFGLEIRAGLECDWIPGIEDWTEWLRSQYPWDYLIGSVHYLGDHFEFDNPLRMDFWNQTSIDEAWELYWERYLQMVRSQLFTIMGHADLIRKFGYRPSGDLKRYYLPVIEAMAESSCILEINTAGWNKPCAEQYPSLEFLQLACEAHIPLVINSDAHAPGDIASEFERARDIALNAGYTQLARLQQNQIISWTQLNA